VHLKVHKIGSSKTKSERKEGEENYDPTTNNNNIHSRIQSIGEGYIPLGRIDGIPRSCRRITRITVVVVAVGIPVSFHYLTLYLNIFDLEGVDMFSSWVVGFGIVNRGRWFLCP